MQLNKFSALESENPSSSASFFKTNDSSDFQTANKNGVKTKPIIVTQSGNLGFSNSSDSRRDSLDGSSQDKVQLSPVLSGSLMGSSISKTIIHSGVLHPPIMKSRANESETNDNQIEAPTELYRPSAPGLGLSLTKVGSIIGKSFSDPSNKSYLHPPSTESGITANFRENLESAVRVLKDTKIEQDTENSLESSRKPFPTFMQHLNSNPPVPKTLPLITIPQPDRITKNFASTSEVDLGQGELENSNETLGTPLSFLLTLKNKKDLAYLQEILALKTNVINLEDENERLKKALLATGESNSSVSLSNNKQSQEEINRLQKEVARLKNLLKERTEELKKKHEEKLHLEEENNKLSIKLGNFVKDLIRLMILPKNQAQSQPQTPLLSMDSSTKDLISFSLDNSSEIMSGRPLTTSNVVDDPCQIKKKENIVLKLNKELNKEYSIDDPGPKNFIPSGGLLIPSGGVLIPASQKPIMSNSYPMPTYDCNILKRTDRPVISEEMEEKFLKKIKTIPVVNVPGTKKQEPELIKQEEVENKKSGNSDSVKEEGESQITALKPPSKLIPILSRPQIIKATKIEEEEDDDDEDDTKNLSDNPDETWNPGSSTANEEVALRNNKMERKIMEKMNSPKMIPIYKYQTPRHDFELSKQAEKQETENTVNEIRSPGPKDGWEEEKPIASIKMDDNKDLQRILENLLNSTPDASIRIRKYDTKFDDEADDENKKSTSDKLKNVYKIFGYRIVCDCLDMPKWRYQHQWQTDLNEFLENQKCTNPDDFKKWVNDTWLRETKKNGYAQKTCDLQSKKDFIRMLEMGNKLKQMEKTEELGEEKRKEIFYADLFRKVAFKWITEAAESFLNEKSTRLSDGNLYKQKIPDFKRLFQRFGITTS